MVLSVLGTSAAVLLLVAGIAKIGTPAPAMALFGRFSRPNARMLVRLSGAVEAAVALAVLIIGGRAAAAALAAVYLVLTGVALRLVRAPARTPCGCFGAADGDVGWAHVVVDVACTAAAVASAVVAMAPARTFWHAGAAPGTLLAAQAVLLAALGYLSITALPALAAARRALEQAS